MDSFYFASAMMLLLSVNFLTLSLGAEFRLKSKIIGAASVFVIVQLLLFMIGWGLARLLLPMLAGHETLLLHSILLFTGLKRIVRAFTVKKQARNFQLVHIFDVMGVSTAVATDAMIFGLAFGMITPNPVNLIFILAALTFFMGVTGIYLRSKKLRTNTGMASELLSGLFILVINIFILFT